jgi:glycosyltransferase involved in cell wall biosynthesis
MVEHKLKISIIIPVYNAENFLEKCLFSAINQSYSNLEIIVVNDGSTDKSVAIIKKFESNDLRVKFFDKENGGIGSAYKVAFEIFTGEFVTFLDSDDYLELDACAKLVDLALKNNADMVQYRKRIIDINGEEINTHSHNSHVGFAKNNEEVVGFYLQHLRHPSLANFYKSTVLKNVTVFDQNVGIDEMLTPQLLVKINTAVFTDVVFYNVFFSPESVSRTTYSKTKILELYKVYTFLLDFLETKNTDLYFHIFEKYEGILYSYSRKCILKSDKQLKVITYNQIKMYIRTAKKYNRHNIVFFYKFIILKNLLFVTKIF